MSDDQFTKLFKYISDIDARTRRIEDEMSTKSGIASLTDTIDAFISRLDHAEIEQVSRDAQWNRLLEWARKVSEKTGVPLPDL